MSFAHARRLVNADRSVSARSANDVPDAKKDRFFSHLEGLPPDTRALVRRIFERGKELCDPQKGIKSVWNKAKSHKIISLDSILDVYIAHALARGDSGQALAKGIKLIAKAYQFAQAAYNENARIDPSTTNRKDAKTPRVAHPFRVGKVGAHLGAEAKDIAALILHDVVEDCRLAGVTLALVQREFGYEISRLVALDSRAKMEIVDGAHRWVYLVSSPEKWQSMRDDFDEMHYQERYQGGFTSILNTHARGITPGMKTTAYVAKWIDGIDSVVTDDHLEPHRREIRIAVLACERRRLRIVAPELDRILLGLLAERGYIIDADHAGSAKATPKQDEKVVELAPITPDAFNCAYLDAYPKPNGTFLLYSKSQRISRGLETGRFKGKIRLELPHDAPANSLDQIRRFFERTNLSLEFFAGKSLAPWASGGAGTIMWVKGINNMTEYRSFRRNLERYHDHYHKMMAGAGTMA
ncbi:HD domain-containing protein [Candidatus Micrarchaeota archaeon]|nr:HD domain-containing protein [Candidatus Micrarchaeota archaeon]